MAPDNRSSFGETDLRQLGQVLYRFALRATKQHELARDLAQDALLAATSGAGTFAGRSSVRTWVIGILSHKIMDHFRRSGALQEEPLTDDDASLVQTASPRDLERVTIARQELALVERALSELPPGERLAILLTDVEGLSRAEACNVLGVNATHLRVLLHRGRHRLRRLLER